jgi:hypothetical protein
LSSEEIGEVVFDVFATEICRTHKNSRDTIAWSLAVKPDV